MSKSKLKGRIEARKNAEMARAVETADLLEILEKLDAAGGQAQSWIAEAARRSAAGISSGASMLWEDGLGFEIAGAAFKSGHGSLYLAEVARAVEKEASKSANAAVKILGEDWRDGLAKSAEAGAPAASGLALTTARKPLEQALASGGSAAVDLRGSLSWTSQALKALAAKLANSEDPRLAMDAILEQIAGAGMASVNMIVAANKRGRLPVCLAEEGATEQPQSSRAAPSQAGRGRK